MTKNSEHKKTEEEKSSIIVNPFSQLQKELPLLILILIAMIIITKIVFLKESVLVILKVVAGLFWMLFLPGFVLLYRWSHGLSLLERVITAVPLSAALFVIVSYPLGLLGVNGKEMGLWLPLLFVIMGAGILWKFPVNNRPGN
ncbi:MAG: hypothetical protein GXP63_03710 [DPANN group archaeon]|nr:hypothetical protein [DPANN group archaeon]